MRPRQWVAGMSVPALRRAIPILRPRRQLSRRSRLDLLAALGAAQPPPGIGTGLARRRVDGPVPACPACRVADEEVRRWFFFYETETNADESVKDRLVAAGGLCSNHTRRLLDHGPATSWLATGLFDLLLRDARDRPRGVTAARRTTRCPVCETVDARVRDLFVMLVAALDHPRDVAAAAQIADAYRAGAGMCVPHAQVFLHGLGSTAAVATPATAELVASVLADRLATTPDLAAPIVTGDDTDASHRAKLRAAAAPAVLAADATARHDGLDQRIAALLTRSSCPICTARVVTTWRMLDWIGSGRALPPPPDAAAAGAASPRTGQDRPYRPGEASAPPRTWRAGVWRPPLVRQGGRPVPRPSSGAGSREEFSGLCAHHIADLIAADGQGGWLSEPVATVVRSAAARWRTWASAVARGAAADKGWEGDRLTVPVEPTSAACLVCRYVARAAERELRLMLVVGADPSRTDEITRSHGPCQRCRQAYGGRALPGWPAWEQAATARTAELALELDEARHRDTFLARWDVGGSILSAWRKGPTRLDGMALGPSLPEPVPSPLGDRRPPPVDADGPSADQPITAPWTPESEG